MRNFIDDSSENSRDGNSSNESATSGLASQDQTGNPYNTLRMLIATRFSPPSRLRDPRLQDPFGPDNSIMDPTHVESSEMDDLISSAQQVSVDDETISTPPFFPSPSRPLSSNIGPSEPVPTTNFKTQLPGFLTAGAYSSATPPTGESSTQSSAYYGHNAPIRSAFDFRLHLPEDAYTRKRRHFDVDEVEEKDEEQAESHDSSNIDKSKDGKSKSDKSKDDESRSDKKKKKEREI